MYQLRLGKSVSYISGIAGRTPVINANFEKELAECKKLGYDCVDFDYTGMSVFYVFAGNLDILSQGLQKIKDAGLAINCVHVPYGSEINPSDLCELRRRGVVEYLKQAFAVMDAFQPRGYVLHPSHEPVEMEKREAHKKQLVKSLKELVGATKNMVCLENMTRTLLCNTVEETMEIVEQVDGLKICVDVNHFLHDMPEDAILRFGNRVGTLHISDHDFINEMHRLPGLGKIDFMKVIGALETIGYDGAFTYEVTMSVGGYVLCTIEDIKNNYDQLFENYNK